MLKWSEFRGWMAFDRLSEDEGVTRAFTVGYRFNDDPADPWTARFNAFKRQPHAALRRAGAMMRDAVPSLVEGLAEDLGLVTSKTVFVPALSSSETVASPGGVLWRLAQFCAECSGVEFAGERITKNAHEQLHGHHDASKRSAILAAADFRSEEIRADNVLILDDFITRGSTMSHLARAMLERNPELLIFAVALGKTERRSYCRENFGVEISNEHVPSRWERRWLDAK
ncbi:phosphoribosyltransferase [Candidatus Palauibacter polyketidifaciens]|uniref:phosphoribosyltransferase n=1 Tax=Candidatus Palauibacter polyketidifaciens TaxID=3056740 RepID=UPI002395CF86|nr:phosphoribosyltransferase [Candidatus Palauibacter polyketidifaciens]MDE2721617.1 phosphoribosyltransferase [Candidatus Palauibacter polyketidifaciens]